jgi:hypothetical protein
MTLPQSDTVGLHRRLADGRLALIGDVHGELDALVALMGALGLDPDDPAHAPGLTLVFVGDLIDRGPDSPGVVALVARWVAAGRAQLVLGNHELNLLKGEEKAGNRGWFFGKPDPAEHVRAEGRPDYPSKQASPEEKSSILAFLAEQPLTLQREDLCVVHAKWDPEAIAATAGFANLEEANAALDDAPGQPTYAVAARLAAPEGLVPRWDEDDARAEAEAQNGHPIKRLTSGTERIPEARQLQHVGGRWRQLERERWWDAWDAAEAVVFGHYWRRRGDSRAFHADPLVGAGKRQNAYCIDFSVGRRYLNRFDASAAHGDLAALVWPAVGEAAPPRIVFDRP